MGAAASSSSSPSFYPKKYDVFISFRGEDTRTNFTSHLHTALCHQSIRTYIDYQLPKGDHISQALIQAIQDSSISLVVFSQNYGSSKWCLDELTQILQCQKNDQQIVIPVFYRVDPSDVRRQNGTYKDAFAKHERDFMYNLHKVENWKYALFEIANLAGWDSQNFRDESELIQNIVNDILRKLDHRYPSALKGLVGIEENCNHIELLLENVPIIGIWGMGGIGKTTMAKAVFSKLVSQFESCCFVENVREESEKHGISYIRDKLILELLKEENLHGSTPKVLGSTFVMRRLSSKKVFIVLDDVNKSEQLEYLARECDCLGPGSRVIITTRDKHLLIGRVNKIYKAMALNYHESMKLFCLKAFHKYNSEIGFEQLSERAVDYAKGIPLALIVLGSFLYSKTKEEWQSALIKLKKTPHEDVQKVLKFSYNRLNDEEREIFLDIACFLKSEHKELVITLLDSYGFHASIGLRTLLDNALITIDWFNKVWMHDLIQEMGWEIIRQESLKEPGRRSRLWDPEEIYHVLRNNKGTDAIEGIILDVPKGRDVHWNVDTFKKMTNLRFLKFYCHEWNPTSYNVNLPSGLEFFSDKLRYFQWDRYPLESLPSTFPVEKLVKLRMRSSHVTKLWDGVQELVNLSEIDLSGCKQLMELPNFSKAQNLQLVDLFNCESLYNVHPSILSLHSLVSLNLAKCKKLKSLKSETHLKSLRHLSLNGSSQKEFSLENLPSIARLIKLRCLHLDCSSLENLPINELCCLKSLKELHIENCGQIIDKPKLHILFDALRSLRELVLEGCSNLYELPDNISALSSLNTLRLNGSGVKSLPSSIKHLSVLYYIDLNNCTSLRSLPELPPSIKYLIASNCKQLEYFSLKQPVFKNYERYEVCYPGSRVPEWFRYKGTTDAPITIELAPPFDNLLGFIFSIVCSQFTYNEEGPCYFEYECYMEDKYVGCWNSHESLPELNSDHVLLYYEQLLSQSILERVKRRGNNEGTIYNPKLSFQFFVFTYDVFGVTFEHDGLIKACGVCPVYADSELELELGTRTKRRRDIDEQQQLPPTKKLKESCMLQRVPQAFELELPTKSNKSQNIDDLLLRLLDLKL